MDTEIYMHFLKRKSIYISMILVLTLSLSFIFGSFLTASNQLATREINVDSIGTLSYEEKVGRLLNDFDMYSYEFNENSLSFNGEITRSVGYFSEFDFLSTITNGEVNQKYSTQLDLEEEKFVLIIGYYQNNELIEKTEQEAIPFFDNEENDYFIKLDILLVRKVKMDLNMDI